MSSTDPADRDDDDDDDVASGPSGAELEAVLAAIPDEVGDDVDLSQGDPVLVQLMDMLPKGKPMPPDLAALYRQVRNQAILRAVLPHRPPVPFEGFEAFDAMVGGMGLVLKARDPELDRFVAIKLWIQSGPAAQAPLLAEARALAKFCHPHVVTIHEAGIWQDRAYFVMEWVDGMDGASWMETRPSWLAIREVFVCVGDGLAAAHDAGLQHRDFNPANMLIGRDGRALVADFGVADSLDQADLFPHAIVGTPTYMAPERLRGEQGDARSDQFSFCVTLWRALYGKRPFAGTTPEGLLASITGGELREDPDVDVPPRLRDVVLRGLALDPDDRHPDMHALVDALLATPIGGDEDDDVSVQAPNPTTPGNRVLHAPSWQPWGAFGGVLGLGLGFVAVLAGFGYGRSPEAPAPMVSVVEPAMPSEQPCAVEVSLELDPVVVQVCRLIRLNEFDAADMLWDLEYNKRVTEDAVLSGEGALIVAKTFLTQSMSLETAAPSKASAAAKLAGVWANVATGHLGEDAHSRDIRTEAHEILGRLAP